MPHCGITNLHMIRSQCGLISLSEMQIWKEY
jgi:hypothetical protein